MTRVIFILIAATLAAPAVAAPPGRRQVRLGEVILAAPLPEDLRHPEGRSRWDLTMLVEGDSFTRTIGERDEAVTLRDEPSSPGRRSSSGVTYTDPYGGDGALRWLYPDTYRDDLRPGTKRTLEIDEAEVAGRSDRLRIDTGIVGIGWIHLPSGPREVVLQRAFVMRGPGDGRGFAPDAVIHRWIDPLAGVVAEVRGPAAANGRDRSRIDSVTILDATISSAATLKIHVSENSDPVLTTLFYGRDRGNGTAISALDPAGYANAGALIAANTWDFSGNTTGTEVAATTTPINSAETCNFAQCGYTQSNSVLERSDKAFNDPNNLYKINDVAETVTSPTDVTVWLRAGAQNEGVAGGFGSGESRFCYITFGAVTRTPVPLWRFSHMDAPGQEFYYQAGDHWEGGPFNCEQNIFNQVCGAPGTFDKLYAKACGTHTGKQLSDVLKGGVVTVPSGHTFNALLVRTVADFCVYLGSGCSSILKTAEVRTVNYLWQVPHLGTVARIQSAQNATDANTFTTVAETNFEFGLFPPRTITLNATADTTASLSWDPGLDTHRITTYKVYWDTDSGSSSPYAFNSVSNPGQVSLAGTTATISGLTPGTPYFFTVTSLSDFRDPSTGVTTSYESLLYPTQVAGDPNFIYPVEVMGGTTCTTCIPSAEVTGVTVTHSGANVQVCWNAVLDPGLIGYRILGSNTKQTDAGYSTVADLGLQTCYTGSPSQIYYVVVARGPAGNGPWGHYGH